ncbi:putative atp synthase subunit g [Golovinomyces cichoracearum]|uniref:Putative atp synthase subunit g n=1 Tax=Golovinomyces cichoracearum TaxID=62708 RepID=A0A420HFH3_9PEZI|nr:putative atp synthase subunit g [Golovinomyces cichoracearum]
MSALFLRALRRRPANNVNGAIRRSIARYESTVNQSTLDSGKSNSAAIATTKAADGLSRAASAAGPALKGISKTLGKVGYQTQHIISFVQGEFSLSTSVVKARGYIRFSDSLNVGLIRTNSYCNLLLPRWFRNFEACFSWTEDVTTSYFQRIFDKIRNPETLLNSISAKNPQEVLRQARNLSNTELAAGAVLFAELLGFFTVGEIIGRFKLIGYRGETAHHH